MVIRKLSDIYQLSNEELEQIIAISADEINFSDEPETDLEFCSKATKISPDLKHKKFDYSPHNLSINRRFSLLKAVKIH